MSPVDPAPALALAQCRGDRRSALRTAVARALRHESAALIVSLVLALAALPACAPSDTVLAKSASAGPLQAPGATIAREVGVMGTHFAVRVEAPTRSAALAASEAAIRAVEAAEARLSNWRADSELARFDPTRARASAQLAADLAALAPCAARVAGAFDPTVASPGRGPHGALDSGGFGKGRALDLALAAARAHGATFVELDLGGQIACVGDGAAHEVRLADPRDRTRAVVAVAHEYTSVATSCQSERSGHVVDPESGAAVVFDGALTVFANAALAADVLSTGLFVLGPERAFELAALHGDFDVLVIERTQRGLRVRTSAGLVGRVRALSPDVCVVHAQPLDEHTENTAPIARAVR